MMKANYSMKEVVIMLPVIGANIEESKEQHSKLQASLMEQFTVFSYDVVTTIYKTDDNIVKAKQFYRYIIPTEKTGVSPRILAVEMARKLGADFAYFRDNDGDLNILPVQHFPKFINHNHGVA